MPQDDGARALWALVTRGTLGTVEVARVLGRDDDRGRRRARDLLKRLAACVPVRALGTGRQRRWAVDPLHGVTRVTAADQVALRVGRDAVSFLEGTLLQEGLEKAVAGEGSAPSQYRWLERKVVHLAEPEPRYEAWSEVIDGIVDALARERRITLEYGEPEASRTHAGLEPLSLVVYRRALYLLARTPGRPEVIRWRVDRMVRVEVGEPFAYPEDWDPHGELSGSFGIHAAPPPELVVLRFSPEVERYVRARTWHPTARVERAADGWTQLEMRAGGRELVRFVLEWGEHCRVVAPDWLRRDVRGALGRALAAYAEDAPT